MRQVTNAMPTTLVYGVGPTEELVLIPREQAEALATLYTAFQDSTTWGTLRAALPFVLYAETAARIKEADDDAEIPDDAASFEPGMIPGFDDGDWPAFPAQDMLAWLPADVQERYGAGDDDAQRPLSRT